MTGVAAPDTVPTASPAPNLPRGRYLDLPGRGRTFFRELPGPPGAPAVVLLHGWTASGALNWYQAFGHLGSKYRVLAPDLRGHARGLRTRRVFRLADCADDVASMLRLVDAAPAIVVGYSMGGPVAQLLWHRHRDLCAGLVFAATAAGFVPGTRERIVFTSTMAAAVGTTRLGHLAARLPGIPTRVQPIFARSTQVGSLPHWAAREFRRHDWRMLLEAGHALGTYHAPWISEVDVPTSVLLTTEDHAVAPKLQQKLADSIEGATIHEVRDGHIICAKSAFAAPLGAAIDDVAGRTQTPATNLR
jgi:pimeloyl-ACP methyl ester carboxylesterase